MDPHPKADPVFGHLSEPGCGTGREDVALFVIAEARSAALASGDAVTLMKLLHADFTWTTHTGARLDREEYVRRNTDGTTRWIRQEMDDVRLIMAGDTAILTCTTVDEIEGVNGPETFRMPMTQVWVHQSDLWVLLAGHAGPRFI